MTQKDDEDMMWFSGRDKSSCLEPLLLAGSIAFLMGGGLYRAEEHIEEDQEGKSPKGAKEVVAIGESYLKDQILLKEEKTRRVAGYIEKLCEEKRVVEVITLVIKDRNFGFGRGNESFTELLTALERYSQEVFPTLVMLVYMERTGPVLDTRSTKLRYLEVDCTSLGKKKTTIDTIVQVATSSVTSLKTLEEQTTDTIEIVKEKGVKEVFNSLFGSGVSSEESTMDV